MPLLHAPVSYGLAAGQEVETLATTNAALTTTINFTRNQLTNRLIGNAGANVLNGKGSADLLYGNGGNDSFVFDNALGSTNIDRLAEFNVADDTIQLVKTIFAALPLGTLAVGAFHAAAGATAAHDADDRIVYNTTNGALYYDADGLGGAGRCNSPCS
jgi:Ca2+-binding RTX toxin-like protein